MTYKYILLFLLLSFKAGAQEQDARLFLYNAGFGGITAGIGAVWNEPRPACRKQAFVRAFWQGCIGGALHYSGKKVLYLINDRRELGYALPAMLLHAAGNSVTENAAFNRPFLQTWSLDYGPLRLDCSFNGRATVRARLLPASLYGVLRAAPGGRPDWKLSLLSGCPSFRTADRMSGTAKLQEAAGFCYGRSILYTSFYADDTYRIVSHELVHYFQFREQQVFNAWLAPSVGKRHGKVKQLFSRYVYFDAPYSSLPYLVEGYHSPPSYYRNFFELEAERFATNRDVTVQ